MKKPQFILIVTAILFWNCASIKAPPGGPVDETPPTIIEINPPSGTVHLNTNEIQIKFSEYMDENSFKNSISIFPRLQETIDYKFKGDEIVLKLPKELDSSKTYIIQLNRNIKDEHNVALSISEQLAFSSGSKISQGIISGKVYGSGQESVHLWKIYDLENDSLFATIPEYITDANDEGIYSFGYLSPGDYKILAVGKSGSELPLNPERTEYGLYWNDIITLAENDTLYNINMRVWNEPQNLKLLSGEWSTYNWGTLFFNNDLSDSLSFSVRLMQGDSLIDFDYFIDAQDGKNLIVQSNDSLSDNSINVIIDSIILNNKIHLDSTEIKIQIPQEPDTTYLQILNPQQNLSIIPNEIDGVNIDLIFSKPVQISNDSTLVPKVFINDSTEIDVLIEHDNPMYYTIKPTAMWEQNEKYKLVLNRDGFTTKFGKGIKDSLYVINISTGKSMGFGGVIGQINGHKDNNVIVELFSTKNPSLSRVADVNSKSQFEFKTIPEGNYSLLFFEDTNKNMKFNFGKAYPMQSSEWFYFYPDTFEVRANWDTEITPIDLPENK